MSIFDGEEESEEVALGGMREVFNRARCVLDCAR